MADAENISNNDVDALPNSSPQTSKTGSPDPDLPSPDKLRILSTSSVSATSVADEELLEDEEYENYEDEEGDEDADDDESAEEGEENSNSYQFPGDEMNLDRNRFRDDGNDNGNDTGQTERSTEEVDPEPPEEEEEEESSSTRILPLLALAESLTDRKSLDDIDVPPSPNDHDQVVRPIIKSESAAADFESQNSNSKSPAPIIKIEQRINPENRNLSDMEAETEVNEDTQESRPEDGSLSGEIPGSPSQEGSVHLTICLVCLKRFPMDQVQVSRSLLESENAFMTLSKHLNMPNSAISLLWDFSKERVPMCDPCYNLAERINELDEQTIIIKAELERNVYNVKRVIEVSEENVNEELTKSFVKWRKLAVKATRMANVVAKYTEQKRNRGRPRKFAKTSTYSSSKLKKGGNRKRKACSVILDSLQVMGSAVPEVLLYEDNYDDSSKYSPVQSDDPERETKYFPPGPKRSKVAVEGDPGSNGDKRKRIQRAPMKITNYANDEDDYDEEWGGSGEAPPNWPGLMDAAEEDNQRGDDGEDDGDSSDENSESDASSEPQRPPKRRAARKSSYASKKSAATPGPTKPRAAYKPRDKGTKWRSDRRKNKLWFGSIEVIFLDKGKCELECSECKHRVEGAKSRSAAKGRMRKHIITQHLGTFKCTHPQCGKVYSGHKELQNHVAAIHKNVKQTCEVCGKPFSFETSLRRHMWSHKNAEEKEAYLASGKKKLGRPDDPCQCDQCGRSFQSSVYLKRHHRVHMDTASRLTHMCTMCGKLFVSTSGLNYHMTSVHDKDNIDKTDWISCPNCPRVFKKRHQLRKHMPVHTGETCCQCSLCGKPFKSLSALRFHRHVHDTERANPCPHCEKAFKRRHHLQRHVKIFHPGGKNLPQRPQNRLKGPKGSDGGPAAAGTSTAPVPRIKKNKNLTMTTAMMTMGGGGGNGHVSVITNTMSSNQDEHSAHSVASVSASASASSRYPQFPLNLANSYNNGPKPELANPISHLHQQSGGGPGQPNFPPTLNYEYPYEFQNLMRF